jgi:hypothetical protein
VNLARFIPVGGRPDFIEARRIINGEDHAQEIAGNAERYLAAMQNAARSAAVA